jgi:uncharacterized membrane protein (UPF0182 family)
MKAVEYERLPYRGPSRRQLSLSWILIALFLILIFARSIASAVIDYQWWKEMSQTSVWFSLLAFSIVPRVGAGLLAFVVFWVAHARGVRFAGRSLRRMTTYRRLSTLGLLVLGLLTGAASIDSWVVVRYFGSRGLPPDATAWQDPAFGNPLSFYLFDLPFYSVLLSYLLAVTVIAMLIYWITGRFWQIRDELPRFEQMGEFDFSILRLEGGLRSSFLRAVGAVLLLALGMKFYLGRYDYLFKDHGFMVGMDYVDQTITLPLQLALVASCVAAAVLLLLGRWKLVAIVPAILVLRSVVPAAVGAIYVRPNEIAIQRPFIERHIEATRSAYGLGKDIQEIEFNANVASRINPDDYRPLLENVRLWDWRAFHDTTTQIQALRPYYVFPDSDVDRYIIDGKLRQVLLSPRELDIRQLPDAQTRWINPHFVYTHGYGLVMAEANRIQPDGLPVLFVQDAPPQIRARTLKLTRPEIYYGEQPHEPVFVRTQQEEFSYPSGNESVFSRYEGTGGFPISNYGLRIAAALRHADVNILLTSLITSESRMMIRRRIQDRIQTLAAFVTWDRDPYLVLTDEGRLIWTIDGYTTSSAHPYSRVMSLQGQGAFNYIRNSVKATVDAYNGTTTIYIFDETDPIIQAYRKLFPTLFRPAADMPPDQRSHARYPEGFFRIQAEIYRTYHMRDPQAFYNKEDVWDIARNLYGPDLRAVPLPPTYVVATLPGENTPEFLLLLPFTPRNKDNMIGLMVARCDGEHLGELLFLQLSKQELIFGPMQIEARINQDQNISKDLNLWNQQGSQVLRGHVLVLPIGDTFLYVEPIYIQAAEARMPQLRKVVLAMGNDLIYRDTYEEALEELAAIGAHTRPAKRPVEVTDAEPTSSPPVTARAAAAESVAISQVRRHLQRYRELSAQGRWAEAGRELEALERLVNSQ